MQIVSLLYCGQFTILMYAILISGRLKLFMQPYILKYDLVFISRFFVQWWD